MFVLDVTGSMNCRAGDQNCGNNGNVEASNSKIDNLRDSVMTFYDTVDASTSDSAQVRYGIVPYSNQVNVGYSLSPAWMKSNHEYQSREGDEVITYDFAPISYEYVRTGGANSWDYQDVVLRNYYDVSYDECVDIFRSIDDDIYNSSNEANWTQVSQTGSDPRITTYEGPVRYEYYEVNRDYDQFYYSGSRRCALNMDFYLYSGESTITVIEGRTERRVFRWAYRPVTWSVTGVHSNGSVSLPTGWEFANETHAWNGCIEEANTVANSVFDPVPAGAYDLDIDLVPTAEQEKWAPMLPSLVYPRSEGGNRTLNDVFQTEQNGSPSNPTDYCPKAARKLEGFGSRTELENWVSESNGFRARGATYHDFGMIWGGRFVSPDGIFSSENAAAPNGDSISRHIVFMTDGTQATGNTVYGLYGQEWWSRKITSNASRNQMEERHGERFQAACRAARNKNISVWVIAFDTAETDNFGNSVVPENLRECATPGRSYLAEDADELDSAFREIAEKIAALRLTA
jgi:hypothetical protein